jgi:hypothetical protein
MEANKSTFASQDQPGDFMNADSWLLDTRQPEMFRLFRQPLNITLGITPH